MMYVRILSIKTKSERVDRMKETFPILGGYGVIPLEVIVPHEEQAKKESLWTEFKKIS